MENYVTWQDMLNFAKFFVELASLIFMVYYYHKKK